MIEEAYNQEEGVVQHISLFRKDPRTGEWSASFTQEWPAGGLRHQLSYTVTYQRVAGDSDAFTGFGDTALNYRYQLIGNGEAKVAVAPRLTVLLPTGSYAKGLGAGGTGLQIGVPVSVLMGNRFVVNGNAGFTWTPSARDAGGEKAGTTAGYAGGSLIWLARPNLNGMLEALWSRGEVVTGSGRTRAESPFRQSRLAMVLRLCERAPDRPRHRRADRRRPEPRTVRACSCISPSSTPSRPRPRADARIAKLRGVERRAVG